MHYSHIYNLNMNEWVPTKGRVKVVPMKAPKSWYRSCTKTLVRNDLR